MSRKKRILDIILDGMGKELSFGKGGVEICEDAVTELSESLIGNTRLKTLHLNNATIENKGAAALAAMLLSNRTIEILNLNNNFIGDLGACALADAITHNKSLRELWLSNNTIGNTGATALAKALENNASLTGLSLISNQFDDAGAIAFSESLRHNCKLEFIFLFRNQFKDQTLIDLIKASDDSLNTTPRDSGLTVAALRRYRPIIGKHTEATMNVRDKARDSNQQATHLPSK